MITKYHIECAQLIIIAGYLIFAWVKRSQQPLTIKLFAWAGILLAIDVIVFRCVRPWFIWSAFNIIEIIGVVVLIYEKIIRQALLVALRELAILGAMLFR